MSKKNLTRNDKNSQSVLSVSVDKYCNKKLLQIEYLTALTPQDEDLLKQLIELGKNYENISGVHFVTYEDVLDLIQRLIGKEKNVVLPDFIRNHATKLIEDFVEPLELTSEALALFTKMKIIESMYSAYVRDVTKMQQRQTLHTELEKLIIYTETSKKKGKQQKGKQKDKKSKSSKSSKQKDKASVLFPKSKEPSKIDIGDYAEIALSENEVIFDYNIDNHVQYVVLSGFSDPLLFEELSKLNVTLSSVIELSSDPPTPNPDHFIRNVFESPVFENTALMKFQASNAKSTLKKTLEELVYVIQRINYIKRQHLHYVRSLTLFDLGRESKKLPVECMVKYNRILDSYPLELVNIPVIIDALIEEICWRELGPIYSLSDLSTDSSELDSPTSKKTELSSYQVHEEDQLKIVLQAYKSIGRQHYDKNIRYLNLLKPLERFEESSKNKDRAVSTEEQCYCCSINEFIDTIHLAIFSRMERFIFKPKQREEYDFIRNLVTYDESEDYSNVLPEVLGKAETTRVSTEKNDVIHNYQLKEDLSTPVLHQLIFKALLDYSYYDSHYCEESGAVLLRFHDNLNDFGIETRLWNQSLTTPVCLRDFCKYITVESKVWLEDNKIPEHKELNEDQEEEKCEGMKDMQVSELYEEYQHLLEKSKNTPTEEKKKTFNSILNELKTYPDSHSLPSFCAQSDGLLAYDVQSSRVGITGHTTIFNSCDGVKVSVDTTRFLTQSPRCSIDISADNAHLIFHSIDPTAFHLHLSDGTLIRFTKFEEKSEEVAFNASNLQLSVELEEPSLGSEEQEQEEEEEDILPNYENHLVQILRKYKLPTTLPNFQKINVSDRTLNLNSKNLDLLLEALNVAVNLQRPLYKISTKKSISLLERKTSPMALPLVKILKHIMFKPVQKKRKIKSYNLIYFPQSKKNKPLNYDFQITLPHGLIITTMPRIRQLTELKQTNKYLKSKEQYRICYGTGSMLIKNADGSTTIYRANGDIVQLSDERKTSVNCTENMKEMFEKEEEEMCPYKSSRCDPPHCWNEDDFKSLAEFEYIPYTIKTLLEFQGRKFTVIDKKIIETQDLYVLSENDYHSEEKFFKREDDLRCLINKNGQRTVQFPDGTKITAFPKVEKELIFVSKNPKAQGWVSVVINYKFEHPNYIPIVYDAFENTTQIFLQNSVIKSDKDTFLLSTEEDVAMEVTCDNIIFLKTCPLCDSDCICKIDLNQELEEKLLEVCDSYDKYFACDKYGNCTVQANYIRKSKNKNKCDHCWKNEDKKLFILNKTSPPGSLLWRDSHVEKKMATNNQLKNVKILNYMNKLTNKQTIEFFTEVYQKFQERFTMTHLYQNKICLSKNKHNEEENKPSPTYVTFRILNEFQNLKENHELLQEFVSFVEANSEMLSPTVLEDVNFMFNNLRVDDKLKDDVCSYRLSMQEMYIQEETDSLIKSQDIEKITVAEVIDTWRAACEEGKNRVKNIVFADYFHSDYYQYILSQLNKQ